MSKSILAFLPLVIGLVRLAACSPAPVGQSPYQAVAEGQAASIMITAEAISAREAAAVRTAEAQGMIQGTAAAIAAADAAVELRLKEQAGVQELQVTAVHLQGIINDQAWALTATPEAAGRAAEAEMTFLNLEVKDKELEQRERQAAIARRELVTRSAPWVGLAIFTLVAGALTYRGILKWKWTEVSAVPDTHRVIIRDNNGVPLISTPPRRATVDNLTVSGPNNLPPRSELSAVGDSHALILGETSTGKSSIMRAVIKLLSGSVFVIDPHYRPGAWPTNVTEIVGAANRYDAVEDLLFWLGEELGRRKERRARNDVDFEPITVAMDEQPDLKDNVSDHALKVWMDLVRQGAKYRMFVVLSSQSVLVKEIGLEGRSAVLRNFSYVVMLGSFAIEKRPELEPLGNRAAVLVKSGGTPTPVVIPYIPQEDPRSSEFRVRPDLPPVNAGVYRNSLPAVVPSASANSHAAGAIVLPASPAEAPQPQESLDPLVYGMTTSRGFVAPMEVGKIVEAAGWGWPQYKIEDHAFGKEGGAFFYMTKEVLIAFGLYKNGK